MDRQRVVQWKKNWPRDWTMQSKWSSDCWRLLDLSLPARLTTFTYPETHKQVISSVTDKISKGITISGPFQTPEIHWQPKSGHWQSNTSTPMGSRRTALAVKHRVLKDCSGSQTWGPEGQLWQSNMGPRQTVLAVTHRVRTALSVKHGFLKNCSGSQTWDP